MSAGSAIAAFGFGEAEAQVAAHVRPFKLAKADRDPQHLPLLLGRLRHHHVLPRAIVKKGEKAEIIHIEGDPDHPTNRGTLCPKGAALLDFVKSQDAHAISADPQAGLATSSSACRWDDALDRIARLMKDDRDANFIAKNNDGVTVNRWTTHRLPRRLRDHQRNGVR